VFSTLVLLFIGATAVQAQDVDADRFTFRGFGTLMATSQRGGEDVDYRRYIGQPRGVADGDVELYTDSIAGAQIDFAFSENFSITAQGVTRMNPDGDWDLELSQGYLRWSPDDSLVVRAGRLGYDIYLLAESRQVGYSYLAVRPSPEIYGLVGNDEVEGADIMYTHRLGHGLGRVRLFGGDSTNEAAFVDGRQAHTAAKIYGAVFDYLYRGWTGRIALVNFSYDPDPRFQQLAAALQMTGLPDSIEIAHGLSRHELASKGVQLGLVYDDGPLQGQLLLTSIESDSIAGPDLENIYTQFGYRLRQWTPFVAFASGTDRNPIKRTGLPDLPMFAPLNGAVYQIQSNLRTTQHTTSVGVRYDLSSHFDFKLQVDRVSLRDSALMLDRRPPAGGPVDMTVIAAGVDFVF
jgi:hypothetical protein